jgi:NAD(P)-dependent dehydrogenase (short-subunit alcohol dehydrogenase family)
MWATPPENCTVEKWPSRKANVVLDYVGDPSGAEDAANQIRSAGSQALTVLCDVSQEGQVVSMFQKAAATFGTVDILINNAGLQKDAPFVDMTVPEWDLVLNVNLKGQFLCAREGPSGNSSGVCQGQEYQWHWAKFSACRVSMKSSPGQATPTTPQQKVEWAC